MTSATILTTEATLREFLSTAGPFAIAVWDFDGVIGDTEPAQADAYRAILARHGILVGEGFFDDLAGLSEVEIWSALQHRYEFEGDITALRQERIAYVTPVLEARVAPNWFVQSGVKALRDAGTSSVIISSGNQEVIDRYLNAWNIGCLFNGVSALSGRSDDRPKHERLRDMIEGTRSLVIEDSAQYLQLASELGAATLKVGHSLNEGSSEAADAFIQSGTEAIP